MPAASRLPFKRNRKTAPSKSTGSKSTSFQDSDFHSFTAPPQMSLESSATSMNPQNLPRRDVHPTSPFRRSRQLEGIPLSSQLTNVLPSSKIGFASPNYPEDLRALEGLRKAESGEKLQSLLAAETLRDTHYALLEANEPTSYLSHNTEESRGYRGCPVNSYSLTHSASLGQCSSAASHESGIHQNRPVGESSFFPQTLLSSSSAVNASTSSCKPLLESINRYQQAVFDLESRLLTNLTSLEQEATEEQNEDAQFRVLFNENITVRPKDYSRAVQNPSGRKAASVKKELHREINSDNAALLSQWEKSFQWGLETVKRRVQRLGAALHLFDALHQEVGQQESQQHYLHEQALLCSHTLVRSAIESKKIDAFLLQELLFLRTEATHTGMAEEKNGAELSPSSIFLVSLPLDAPALSPTVSLGVAFPSGAREVAGATLRTTTTSSPSSLIRRTKNVDNSGAHSIVFSSVPRFALVELHLLVSLRGVTLLQDVQLAIPHLEALVEKFALGSLSASSESLRIDAWKHMQHQVNLLHDTLAFQRKQLASELREQHEMRQALLSAVRATNTYPGRFGSSETLRDGRMYLPLASVSLRQRLHRKSRRTDSENSAPPADAPEDHTGAEESNVPTPFSMKFDPSLYPPPPKPARSVLLSGFPRKRAAGSPPRHSAVLPKSPKKSVESRPSRRLSIFNWLRTQSESEATEGKGRATMRKRSRSLDETKDHKRKRKNTSTSFSASETSNRSGTAFSRSTSTSSIGSSIETNSERRSSTDDDLRTSSVASSCSSVSTGEACFKGRQDTKSPRKIPEKYMVRSCDEGGKAHSESKRSKGGQSGSITPRATICTSEKSSVEKSESMSITEEKKESLPRGYPVFQTVAGFFRSVTNRALDFSGSDSD